MNIQIANFGLEAIIFDFDGVFVDTETQRAKSYYFALERNYLDAISGVTLEHYLEWFPHGLSRQKTCEENIRKFGIAAECEEKAKKLVAAGKIEKPTAWEALAHDRGIEYEKIKDNAPLITPAKVFFEEIAPHIKTGLATRSRKEEAIYQMEKLGINYALFQSMVCEDTLSKPDNEGSKAPFYRQACDELRVKPANSGAIEDTAIGIRDAKKAGIGFVIAVPTHGTRKQDFIGAGADIIIPSLSYIIIN